MSYIQLPDYPWEHPHESDYEEARAMSDSATRIAELEAQATKYEALLREQATEISRPFLARIAELEAQVARLTKEAKA
jgi:hypothetical protein